MFAAIWTIKILDKRKVAFTLTIGNLILLILFPFWLYIYTDGVISNSDGATTDMKIHLGIGLLIYLLQLAINIITLKRIKNANS